MMKKILILNIIIMVLFFGCKKNEIVKTQNPIYQSGYENKAILDSLLRKAIILGDTIAYKRAYKEFQISGHNKEFLYFSIKMAERNNYLKAYFDVYQIIKVNDMIEKFDDKKTSNIGLFYLIKAYKKGDKNSRDEIEILFPNKKLIPNMSDLSL
jgi:hypothetical protein